VRRKSTEKQPTPLPPDVISGKNIREREKKEKCERKRGKIKGREKFKLPE
jgi:hypothetical protein